MRTLLLSALSMAALGAPAIAQGDFVFTLNQSASAFTWSGTTSLGDIVENPANFNLAGTTVLTLGGGGNPVGSAAFPSAGDAFVVPNAIGGEIPNPIPFAPPLATLTLSNLHATINSGSFTVNNSGGFSTTVTLSFISGNLNVMPLIGTAINQDLTGLVSDPTLVNGALNFDGTKYTVSAPVSGVFAFADPGSGITGSITLNGTVVADHVPVAPSVYCASTPNSTGGIAAIAFAGTPSLDQGNPTIDVTGLPSNTFGVVFYGPNQANTPFGNGIRCVGGPIQRLIPVNSGPLGAISQLVDNSALPANSPAIVGGDLNFQFWFRDIAAGGAQFNTSDALTIRYTP